MPYKRMPYKIEDIKNEGWDTIHKAAYCGDYDVLLEELNNGVSANYTSKKLHSIYYPPFGKKIEVYFSNVYPLYLAAQKGHQKCIKLLMDRGADPTILATNTEFNTTCDAYSVALWEGKLSTYRLLKSKHKKNNLSALTNTYKTALIAN